MEKMPPISLDPILDLSEAAVEVLAVIARSEKHISMLDDYQRWGMDTDPRNMLDLKILAPMRDGLRPVDIAKTLGKSKAAVTRQVKLLLEGEYIKYREKTRKNKILLVNWDRIFLGFINYTKFWRINREDEESKEIMDALGPEMVKRMDKILNKRLMKRFIITYMANRLSYRFKTPTSMTEVILDFDPYVIRLVTSHIYPMVKKGIVDLLESNEREFIRDLILISIFCRPYREPGESQATEIIRKMVNKKGFLLPDLMLDVRQKLAMHYIKEFSQEKIQGKGMLDEFLVSTKLIEAIAEGKEISDKKLEMDIKKRRKADLEVLKDLDGVVWQKKKRKSK